MRKKRGGNYRALARKGGWGSRNQVKKYDFMLRLDEIGKGREYANDPPGREKGRETFR